MKKTIGLLAILTVSCIGQQIPCKFATGCKGSAITVYDSTKTTQGGVSGYYCSNCTTSTGLWCCQHEEPFVWKGDSLYDRESGRRIGVIWISSDGSVNIDGPDGKFIGNYITRDKAVSALEVSAMTTPNSWFRCDSPGGCEVRINKGQEYSVRQVKKESK